MSNGDELKALIYQECSGCIKERMHWQRFALTTVDDPSHYGVARLDGSRIVEFIEKPKKEDAPSNLINAGFYIMEPEAIDMIPNGFSMLEKMFFRSLQKREDYEDFRLQVEWFDIGNIERYKIAEKNWKGVTQVEEDDEELE